MHANEMRNVANCRRSQDAAGRNVSRAMAAKLQRSGKKARDRRLLCITINEYIITPFLPSAGRAAWKTLEEAKVIADSDLAPVGHGAQIHEEPDEVATVSISDELPLH